MKLKYINKIKANIKLYTNNKSSNILDGTYKSVYKGKSMNFENLREYVINDDVKDIDWKSSARSGTLLVKQFISEKKHNIMLVMDTGIKMNADTDKHENKKEIALYAGGTLGYLSIHNDDYIGMLYSSLDKIIYKPFRYNLFNLEEYLTEYDKNAYNEGININECLKYIYKNIKKKMIIFVVTDIEGMDSIESKTLKQLNQNNDVLFININDNYMYGDNIFDISCNKYIPSNILNDKTLNKLEKETRENLYRKNKNKLKRNNISVVSISSINEINSKILELIEEHKYASNH